MFSADALQDATAAVRHFQPDVIGLSLRNLDNQSALHPVWHIPAVRDLIAHLRAVSIATVVCGGPAFSILPAACFEYVEPDLGLAGMRRRHSHNSLTAWTAAHVYHPSRPGLP